MELLFGNALHLPETFHTLYVILTWEAKTVWCFLIAQGSATQLKTKCIHSSGFFKKFLIFFCAYESFKEWVTSAKVDMLMILTQ